ncbi:hypothetical protein DIPPA_02215 [Diplonema papillatum]|nr:hypothetical protein DIPPA_02215 [Diplonema papillatum]
MPRIGEGHRTAWQYAAAAVLPWLLVASWAVREPLLAVAAEAEGAASRAAGVAAKREGYRRTVARPRLAAGHAAVAVWVAAHPRPGWLHTCIRMRMRMQI